MAAFALRTRRHRLLAAGLATAVVGFQLVATVPAGAVVSTFTVDSPSVGEPGDIGFTNELAFTVTRPTSGSADAVDYQTVDGTAKAGSDYVATSGSLSFGANEISKQVRVVVLGDNLDESDEVFTLDLSQGVTHIATGTATIHDDGDTPPAISVANTRVREGNAGTIGAGFVVSLSNASGRTVTVNYATADGTAKAGSDYTATSGTLSFAPGQRSAVVSVPVAGDVLDEDDETFTLTLSNPTFATLADASATGTIENDDSPPSLSINDVVTPDEKAPAHFTVTLSAPSGRPVAVDVTAGGSLNLPSATPGADFNQPTPSHLVFAPGTTSLPVDVPIVDDSIDEPAEHFTVSLSNPDHATLGKAVGAGTITDDDLGPNLKIGDVTKNEGTGVPNGVFAFPVTLSGPPTTQTVTVDYAVKDGTAIAPGDYTVTTPPSATGQLTFPAGTTTRQVVVTVNPDALAEADETFTVELSNASAGVNIDKAVGLGTILNDDGPPATLSVDDVTVPEGAGSGHFTVALSTASLQPVTVNYAMKNGTATDPSDFGGSSGSLTFLANSTATQTVNFTVVQDSLHEANETFTIELSNPINALVSKGTGTATITDDDAAPVVSITPTLAVPEGNSGTTTGTLDVTLSAASGLPAQVNFASAAGTAEAGTDYTVDQNNTLVFAPGETSKQIQLTVIGDTLYEADETFAVTLSAPQGATVGGATSTITITNDDAAPMVHIDGTSVIEPPSATSSPASASFPVRLSAVSGKAVTVKYKTTAGTATAGSDYTTVTNGSITIPAGAQAGAAVVDVLGDNAIEGNETYTVTLFAPVDATLDPNGTVATGTIVDNDGPAKVSITPTVTVKEGDTTASAVLTVSLLPAQGAPVTVDYATADGTAKAPADYTAKTATTITFAAGETVKTVSVNIVGDTIDEPDENFAVNLSNPTGGATIATGEGTGTVTIKDDDGPTISVADLSVIEGNSGTRTAAFAVRLSAPSPQSVSVSYGTSDGTARAPADYIAASGTLTFAPGETFKTVNVNVVGDTIDEADEDFTLGLSSPVNATIARAQGRAVIVDDDQPTVTVVVAGSPGPGAGLAPTVKEGDDGFTPLTFTLTLDAATTRESSLDYTTVDGTAHAGADYLPASGRLTFAPGETTKTVVVQVIGDVRKEADETFTLSLSGPLNVTIAGNGIGTILDDDKPGYALVASDGGLFSFGSAGFFGSTGNIKLNKPIVGGAPTPSGRGYWLVASDGGLFAFGDAGFFGSTGNIKLNQPIVGMASTPSGKGYWLVATDGGIFAFGDALFQGSTGAIRLNKPVVGMASTPSGKGYWLVATDGGIFAFGDALFQGSTGAIKLNKPVVGMASTPSGKGYWLVATDGGIFAFGDALFQGSTGAIRLNKPVVGMASTPSGKGYWLVATDGGVFSFGDAGFLGSTGNITLNQPIVGMIDL